MHFFIVVIQKMYIFVAVLYQVINCINTFKNLPL